MNDTQFRPRLEAALRSHLMAPEVPRGVGGTDCTCRTLVVSEAVDSKGTERWTWS